MVKLRHITNDVCFLVANSREFIIYDIILLALEKTSRLRWPNSYFIHNCLLWFNGLTATTWRKKTNTNNKIDLLTFFSQQFETVAGEFRGWASETVLLYEEVVSRPSALRKNPATAVVHFNFSLFRLRYCWDAKMRKALQAGWLVRRFSVIKSFCHLHSSRDGWSLTQFVMPYMKPF